MVEGGKPNKRALAGFRHKEDTVKPHKTTKAKETKAPHVKAEGKTKAEREAQHRVRHVKPKKGK